MFVGPRKATASSRSAGDSWQTRDDWRGLLAIVSTFQLHVLCRFAAFACAVQSGGWVLKNPHCGSLFFLYSRPGMIFENSGKDSVQALWGLSAPLFLASHSAQQPKISQYLDATSWQCSWALKYQSELLCFARIHFKASWDLSQVTKLAYSIVLALH